jgi:drug/metabolite transporter (DMT)-like permease
VGFAGLQTYFWAVTKLPLVDVTVIFYTHPAFTALVAAMVLKESMQRQEVIGLFVSLVGVVLVAQPTFLFGDGTQGLNPWAVVAALASAAISALAYTLVRKLRETDHHLTVIFYYPLVATPLSVPIMIPNATWPTAVEWLILAGLGIVTQIAHVFMTKGLHAERAGKAMSMSYVQILFALIWGLVFFGEIPSLWGLAGATLVVGGTLLVVGRPAISRPASI